MDVLIYSQFSAMLEIDWLWADTMAPRPLCSVRDVRDTENLLCLLILHAGGFIHYDVWTVFWGLDASYCASRYAVCALGANSGEQHVCQIQQNADAFRDARGAGGSASFGCKRSVLCGDPTDRGEFDGSL